MAQPRASSQTLPKAPSLAQLGLSLSEVRSSPPPLVSDGSKKVPYQATRPRNVRPYQTPVAPVRGHPATVETSVPTPTSTKYPDLKIIPHGESIAQYIQRVPVIAIDSPTGTGKTRYIPYLMAMKGFRVRVAIPTTVAVRDAYKFQREHSKLRVGYAAGREIHYSDDDQLVYATTGHFTSRVIGLVKAGHREQVRQVFGDILFVDEVHTSTSHITLLIGLVRFLFTTPGGQYIGPKLVFLTATFNHGDIIDHFADFPVYTVSVQAYPVETIFLPPGTRHNPLRDDPNPLIVSIIRQELARFKLDPSRPYHGIIFRPGVSEVEETIEALEGAFSVDEPIEFYPAYSSLAPAEIDEIFQKSNKMKVIIGTNIIESSITVEDVGFIVNDMLEKIAETSATGGNKLTLSLVSKAASQQRRGRTGRTMPGRAYNLITEADYEQLAPFRTREIDRVPIYDIVLQLIDAGLNPRDILKISIPRYQQARDVLIQFGMIEVQADRYLVTETGRFVSSIPLSVQNAYMIYLGYQRYREYSRTHMETSAERILLRTVIAVASMIEVYGPSYFFVPRKRRDETMTEYLARKDAHIDKYHEKFRGPTDIHTFVNIFWSMMSDIDVARRYDQQTRHNFMNYIRDWARDNSMNNKKIKEFLAVMRDVESIIESKMNEEVSLRESLPKSGQAETLPRGASGQNGFSIGRDLPDGGYVTLGNAVVPIFSRAYQVNLFILDPDRRGNPLYLDQRTGIKYKINQNSSFNSITDDPPAIIAAQTVEVVGKRGRVNLAGIFVPSTFLSAPPQEERKDEA